MDTIKILFLASEADPLVKVGGLGDVAGSLPQALVELPAGKNDGVHLDARLVIPFHGLIRKKINPPEFLFTFDVSTRDGVIQAQAYQTQANGVIIYLIAGEPIGEDEPVYSPDAEAGGYKYIFFSMASLELMKKLDWKPDILHANDWHTSLAIYAMHIQQEATPDFKSIRTVLSVHNLPFMGAGSEAAFDAFGLPASQYPRVPWWGRKFPLPLGMQTADRIVAVSPTYAEEILTPEYGCGLEGMLLARHKAVMGIVNGLDVKSWDPKTDPAIPVNFSADTLEKRRENKAALAKEFSLRVDENIPLLILISRMDQQKGVDLAIEGLSLCRKHKWQAILLGTGDPKLEEACRSLEKENQETVRAAIRFDAKLSRRMYAGGDILLMPSRYEPCGLAQMMAMRYGCIPLARATGGLRDTILDADESLSGTGFLFKPATAAAFAETLQRALDAYPDKERWSMIQKRGMGQDFSWENSAIQYGALYRELMR